MIKKSRSKRTSGWDALIQEHVAAGGPMTHISFGRIFEPAPGEESVFASCHVLAMKDDPDFKMVFGEDFLQSLETEHAGHRSGDMGRCNAWLCPCGHGSLEQLAENFWPCDEDGSVDHVHHSHWICRECGRVFEPESAKSTCRREITYEQERTDYSLLTSSLAPKISTKQVEALAAAALGDSYASIQGLDGARIATDVKIDVDGNLLISSARTSQRKPPIGFAASAFLRLTSALDLTGYAFVQICTDADFYAMTGAVVRQDGTLLFSATTCTESLGQ